MKKVNYDNVNIPNYWGLSMNHANKIKASIVDYYKSLVVFYGDEKLYNILNKIQKICRNISLLAKNTPCFTSITYNDSILKPIFDERTSKLLYEYYLLKVLTNYVELTNEPDMIVTETVEQLEVMNVFSVEYIEERNVRMQTEVDTIIQSDTILLNGNKKQLKEKIVHLLVVFIQTMAKHKELIDVSYDDIQDRIFKLKEREKDMMTDRLKVMSDELRDVDTILKINKLGVWSKGLQKGLTNYVKENYDEEANFRDEMDKIERKIRSSNKNASDSNIEQYVEDYLEQQDMELYADNDAYDMRGYTEDYYDGNFEGDEVENYEDYY